MTRTLLLFLALAVPAAAADGPPPPHDGDTMYVAPGPETPACSRLRWGQWESVRIMGIDTPEMEGDCEGERALAVEARSRLIELIGSGPVELKRHGCDRYERTLADVSVGGRNVASVLITEGLGRPYQGGRRSTWCSEVPLPKPRPAGL